MWVSIPKFMEVMLGISLYSYLYPKLAKIMYLSYYLLCFLSHKIREALGTGPAWKQGLGVEGVVREVAQTMYTHISKCKNDKRRKK
jgi:hypothetical protein